MADVSQTAANVRKSANANPSFGTAGAAITAGQVLYTDTANGNVQKLADQNDPSALAQVVSGIALNNAASGQPIAYVLPDAALNIGATLTAGAVAYLSDTPGGITITYADVASSSPVVVLGVANTDGTLNFSPLVGGVKP